MGWIAIIFIVIFLMALVHDAGEDYRQKTDGIKKRSNRS